MSFISRADGLLAVAGVALTLGMAAPANAAGCGGEYVVQQGDSLSRIAARCETSVDALMDLNPQITSAANISIGWKLAVPGDAASDDEGMSTQDPIAALDAGPMNLRGWIVNGQRCALLTTPDGEEYGVVSPELSFVSGRAVQVEGRMVDDPTCTGPRTLLVTGLSTTEL